VLRRVGISVSLLGLFLVSCAPHAQLARTLAERLPPVAMDFFAPAPADNPWKLKIQNWQARHHLDPARNGQVLPERSGLAAEYDAFALGLRRRIASETIRWVQDKSRGHYRADGERDHWATLGEVIEAGEDDCDGLDLLTFELLRRMGFQKNEIYRAIVVEGSSGQHHMVTLWFEDGSRDDPFVLDPTGVVTSQMVRLSNVAGWEPIEIFDEQAHYRVESSAVAVSMAD
jgi:hypothetical protein